MIEYGQEEWCPYCDARFFCIVMEDPFKADINYKICPHCGTILLESKELFFKTFDMNYED